MLEHYQPTVAFQGEAFWHEAESAEGYALLAETYDTSPNPLIDLDNATLRPLLDRYAPGRALDTACGTGRWATYLAQRGHAVKGIDESAEMLAIARAKAPGVEFVQGDLRSLPVPDASIDLVVCSLALTYLPELDGVFAEFARVLREGGAAAEVPWPEIEGGHGGPTAKRWCPEAARAACVGTPALMVLDLGR